MADLSTLVARIDADHSRVRIAVPICADIVWATLQSHSIQRSGSLLLLFFQFFALLQLDQFNPATRKPKDQSKLLTAGHWQVLRQLHWPV